MSYKYLCSIFSLFLFVSCSNTKQFDVYAINETSEALQIIIKNDDGEQSLPLAPQERKRIIHTGLLETESSRTMAADCSFVAESIIALNSKGESSTLRWCSDDVAFSVVDIGQGEFTLTYRTEDFK